MTQTRYAHRPAAPTFTSGGDEVRAKCAGEYELYWALIDAPSDRLLAKQAAAICRTCPLAATCLTRTDDPHWSRAALSILRTCVGKAPKEGSRRRRLVAACGTESGYKRHRRLGELACEECLSAVREIRQRQYQAQRERQEAS